MRFCLLTSSLTMQILQLSSVCVAAQAGRTAEHHHMPPAEDRSLICTQCMAGTLAAQATAAAKSALSALASGQLKGRLGVKQVAQSLLWAARPVCREEASMPREAFVTCALSTRGGLHIQLAPSTTCAYAV